MVFFNDLSHRKFVILLFFIFLFKSNCRSNGFQPNPAQLCFSLVDFHFQQEDFGECCFDRLIDTKPPREEFRSTTMPGMP